ncbi:hypothetical protein LAWI1_G008476 [Lachnellula willkommii]|uniref:Uncharacterized protein n=1 Tax=Lachnellula willkommii TaxID=215461 RepID=A0A559LYU2_9HELO|nr:hypothetical protein LAWI1_G008476 [Lachnellula willkommii]
MRLSACLLKPHITKRSSPPSSTPNPSTTPIPPQTQTQHVVVRKEVQRAIRYVHWRTRPKTKGAMNANLHFNSQAIGSFFLCRGGRIYRTRILIRNRPHHDVRNQLLRQHVDEQ